MKLPGPLDAIRHTRWWERLHDWRYLFGHRAQVQFFRRIIPAGARVFDIGANVGHYTLVFRRLGARVIAFEPQASLAAQLERRFAGDAHVTVVQAALGSGPAAATLHKAPGGTELASLRSDIQARSRFGASHCFSENETVTIATLDSMVDRFGAPDFCKIDVEGYEGEVLAGMQRPLPLLSFEFTREFWPETLRCLERLEALGAYTFNYTLGTCSAFTSPQWQPATAVARELAQNRDPLLWGDLYARLEVPAGRAADHVNPAN